MRRAGIVFLWVYRKEALSLAYLFFVGLAFVAIWNFYDSERNKTPSFGQELKITEVALADIEMPVERLEIMPAAWQTNAVQVVADVDDKAQISIIIDDLGLLPDMTLNIINLDAFLTLSFLPYAPDLAEVTAYAREQGHELMLHLPMEPKGNKYPGPHALLTGASEDKIRQDLNFNLAQFEGYVGLNNHMGSAFTENAPGLDLVLNEVQKRGLLILDSQTSQKSLFAMMATDRNIPNETRDIFLDNEQDVTYILAQLAKLEDLARYRGNAIAIGHPYAQTIEALSLWLPTLEGKGIALVPLSHLIKKKYDKILLAQNRAKNAVTSGGQASSSR